MPDIYDFHSHILPGIDDGSRNTDMTKLMLQMEDSQGVSHILFTPHFYAQRQSITRFIEDRKSALEKTEELMNQMGTEIETKAAAETYFFKGISEAEILDDLCMHTEGKSVLFLEMPFEQWKSSMYHEVESIVRKRELSVVLVHIERFAEFQKDRGVWDQMIELPVVLQHNAEFFEHGKFGLFGKEGKIAKETVFGERPLILGTDAHNTSSRHPNMAAGRKVVEQKFGSDILNQIDRRSRKLWTEGTAD